MRTLLALMLFVSSSLVLAAPATPAPEALGPLTINPQAIFVKESTHVVIRVPAPNTKGEPLLVQVDDEGRLIQYMGTLSDVGRWGDALRGDGNYGRDFQVTAKHGGLLHYAVLPHDAPALEPGTVIQGPRIALEILARPTMIQALRQIWARFAGEAPATPR